MNDRRSWLSLQENILFRSIKCWSQGGRLSSDDQVADQQLLALINEIRLENIPNQQINLILEDEWMQKVTA